MNMKPWTLKAGILNYIDYNYKFNHSFQVWILPTAYTSVSAEAGSDTSTQHYVVIPIPAPLLRT